MNAVAHLMLVRVSLEVSLFLLLTIAWPLIADAAICPPRPVDCVAYSQIGSDQNQSAQRVCIDQSFDGALQLPSQTRYVWIAPAVPVGLVGELHFQGVLVNCGELVFPEVNADEGFLFRNYASATVDKPWLFSGAAEIVNYSQGTIQFGVPLNVKENARIINDGHLVSLATLQSDPGTELVNKGFLNIVGGNFDPNGVVDNQGFIETNRFININGQSAVVNSCKFIADQGFNNNSPDTVNNGYIFVGDNALLQMNADFHQGENGFVVGSHFLSSGAITGAGAYYFAGDTRSQGTFGLDGLGINFYDASSMDGRIFDFHGLAPHASVTRAFIPPPQPDGIAPRCSPELVDQFPMLTISPIAGDDVLSLIEDNFALEISGTALHVENGQEVSVALAGESYHAVVFAGVWSISIPAEVAARLPENNQVIANVTNVQGESATPAIRRFIHIQPMPQVHIDVVAGDDVINATEDNYPVLIEGTAQDVEDHQVLNLRVHDQSFSVSVLGGRWQLEISAQLASALPQRFYVTADVMTQSGLAAPQAKRRVRHTVDLPAIMILPIAGDDIISLAESDSDLLIGGVTENVESGQRVSLVVAGQDFFTHTDESSWSLTLPQTVVQTLAETSVFTATVSNVAGDQALPATRAIERILNPPELTISAITGDDYVNSVESLSAVVLEGFALHLRDNEPVDVQIALPNGQFFDQANVNNSRWELTLPANIVALLPSEFSVEVNAQNHAGDIAPMVSRYARRAIALDSDGDGLPDVYEGAGDFDQDGIADYLDVDSDNDGISDHVEGYDYYIDANHNGIFDVFDALITGGPDADFNDVDDSALARDFDGDGRPDYRDFDSDNDSVVDVLETANDVDGDGFGNYLDLDSDGDGLTDIQEGQVMAMVALDTDQDGTPNYLDTDSDNDGLTDLQEAPGGIFIDSDNDGLADTHDVDSDNDGLSDAFESGVFFDDDSDGIANHADADFYRTVLVEQDFYEMDADGDGIADRADADVLGQLRFDLNRDGIWDVVFWRDSDGDNVPDFRDLDSDNDGVPDADEIGGYGLPSVVATGRINGRDALEQLAARDSDLDGFFDHLDLDSDNDGLSDAWESGLRHLDPDGDGQIGGRVVADANFDGWPDLADPNLGGIRAAAIDSDFDSLVDRLSLDSDGDGRFDNAEILGQEFITQWDVDQNGHIDMNVSSDINATQTHDLFIAPVVPGHTRLSMAGCNNVRIDDGIKQYLQRLGIFSDNPTQQDFDRDGYLDILEVLFGGNPLDGAEYDSDGDGVPDWVQQTDLSGLGLNDGDDDGLWDLLEFAAGLNFTAFDESLAGFIEIERVLFSPERYHGRSAEPVTWVEASQAGEFIAIADNVRAITLHARQGNYHVFNKGAVGTPSEKPVYQWFDAEDRLMGVGQRLELPPLNTGDHHFYLVVVWQGRKYRSSYSLRVASEFIRDNDRDGIADALDPHHAELGFLHMLYSSSHDISAVMAYSPLNNAERNWRDQAVRLRLGAYARHFGNGLIHFAPETLVESYIADQSTDHYDGSAHEKTTITRIYSGPAYHFEVVNLPFVGASVHLSVKLVTPLPSHAILHQWHGREGNWRNNFDANSSQSIDGLCEVDGGENVAIGLKASFDCVHLIIEDGGMGDADGQRNGSVEILMGVSGEHKEREKGAITTGVAGGAIGGIWGVMAILLGLVVRGRVLWLTVASRKWNLVESVLTLALTMLVFFSPLVNAAPKKCSSGKAFSAEQGGFHCSGLYLGFGGLAASLTPKITNVPETLDEGSYGLGIYGYVGYDINAYWSVEGHYSDQGHAVFDSGAKIRYRYAGYSALFHFTNHLPIFNVYAKTGIGWLETELDQGRDDHAGFAFSQENDQQIHWGVGATLQSKGGLGVRAEYLWVDQDSQQVSLSVIKRFGRRVRPVPSARDTDSQQETKIIRLNRETTEGVNKPDASKSTGRMYL